MNTVKYVGPSIMDMLFVLFVGLKLASVITWSWWFVFAPWYGPYILGFMVNTYYRWKVNRVIAAQGK